jgi:hypothetical protein
MTWYILYVDLIHIFIMVYNLLRKLKGHENIILDRSYVIKVPINLIENDIFFPEENINLLY